MTATEQIIDILAKHDVIKGVVGTRVYAFEAPQGAARPYAVLAVIGTPDRVRDLSGDTGLRKVELQLDFTGLKAKELRLVLDSIDSIQGKQTNRPPLLWVWVDDTTETVAPAQQGQQRSDKILTIPITVWEQK